MAGYVVLGKWTTQGITNVKDSPNRLQKAKEAAEKMGIRFVGFWVTMGEYDHVSVWDAPDDKTMGAFLLATGMQGFITTTTMRAFSEDEFKQIIGKMP